MRIENHEYGGIMEFVSDVQLMIKSAVQYYGSSHEVQLLIYLFCGLMYMNVFFLALFSKDNLLTGPVMYFPKIKEGYISSFLLSYLHVFTQTLHIGDSLYLLDLSIYMLFDVTFRCTVHLPVDVLFLLI